MVILIISHVLTIFILFTKLKRLNYNNGLTAMRDLLIKWRFSIARNNTVTDCHWQSCSWQWCWWHCYVGDRFEMLVAETSWIGHHLESVNIRNRSPTYQTCHQRICSPTSVTNINVTTLRWSEQSQDSRHFLPGSQTSFSILSTKV